MKYLKKRGGCYYIRVPRPPASWGCKGEFVHTLRTSNLTEARRLRDKYLLPILAESAAGDMVHALASSMARADANVKKQLADFGYHMGDDQNLPSVGVLFDKLIEYKKAGKSAKATGDSYQATKVCMQRLGLDLPINELTKRDFTAMRDKLLKLPSGWVKKKGPLVNAAEGEKTCSAVTVNNHLRRFRTLWSWCIAEGYFAKADCPAEGVIAEKSAKGKSKRPITTVEADMVFDMTNPHVKNVDEKTWHYLPIIARYTGARLAEVAQLTTDDVVTVQNVLCFSINDYEDKSTKNIQSVRFVPISTKLQELIGPLLRECESAVDRVELFPARGDVQNKIAHDFSKAFNNRVKAIGAHITFHGLRSYAITQMANAGIGEIDRKRIVGHKDSTTHAGYTSSDLSRFLLAVNTIA